VLGGTHQFHVYIRLRSVWPFIRHLVCVQPTPHSAMSIRAVLASALVGVCSGLTSPPWDYTPSKVTNVCVDATAKTSGQRANQRESLASCRRPVQQLLRRRSCILCNAIPSKAGHCIRITWPVVSQPHSTPLFSAVLTQLSMRHGSQRCNLFSCTRPAAGRSTHVPADSCARADRA
jgi:hypothetical protein